MTHPHGSDVQETPDWWYASDGRWYPPHLHPDYKAPPPPPLPPGYTPEGTVPEASASSAPVIDVTEGGATVAGAAAARETLASTRERVANVGGAAADAGGPVAGTVSGAAGEVDDAVSGAAGGIVDSASDIAGSAGSVVGGAASGVVGSGEDLVSGVRETVRGDAAGIDELGDRASGIVGDGESALADATQIPAVSRVVDPKAIRETAIDASSNVAADVAGREAVRLPDPDPASVVAPPAVPEVPQHPPTVATPEQAPLASAAVSPPVPPVSPAPRLTQSVPPVQPTAIAPTVETSRTASYPSYSATGYEGYDDSISQSKKRPRSVIAGLLAMLGGAVAIALSLMDWAELSVRSVGGDLKAFSAIPAFDSSGMVTLIAGAALAFVGLMLLFGVPKQLFWGILAFVGGAAIVGTVVYSLIDIADLPNRYLPVWSGDPDASLDDRISASLLWALWGVGAGGVLGVMAAPFVNRK